MHAKLVSQRLLRNCSRNISRSNFANSIFREFRLPVFFSLRCRLRMLLKSASEFARHVHPVFFDCPKKKMLRIAARRIVAFVKNANPFRNGTERNEPCYPTGNVRLFFSPCNDAKLAVSSPSSASFPLPAFIGLADSHLLPKSFPVRIRQKWNDAVRFHASNLRVWLSVFRWVTPTECAPFFYHRLVTLTT